MYNTYIYIYIYMHTILHICIYGYIYMYIRIYIYRRGDTYCKLVKPLKTPSGTLVSWLSARERYLWAWQT